LLTPAIKAAVVAVIVYVNERRVMIMVVFPL
jgi:hypothetical protein